MAKPQRRTRADREREYEAREKAVWREFIPKLAALQTFADALRLVSQQPPPDSPGRRYYANLRFFLGSFCVPAGSSDTERVSYIRFIERLEAAGELKPDVAARVLKALRNSLPEHLQSR